MKYIRTEDGVYKIMSFNVEHIVYDFDKDNSPRHIYLENVIAKADTIEELCDEFVCLENKMTFHNLETITSSCNLKHLTIYGAIWTNKGLIYVAKMNDKGELELL